MGNSVGAEVQLNVQHAAVPQLPTRADRPFAEHRNTQGVGAGQAWDDFAVANQQQLPVQGLGAVAYAVVPGGEVGARVFEGLWGIGVGYALATVGVGKGFEAGELIAPAFAHQLREVAVMAGKKQEGLIGGHFVAHEQQGNHRRQ
ncbi:hypothetical protein D3C81_1611130 [compost metagenome]